MIAVFLVLALAGSALAITQERLYRGDEAEASGVQAIQQHSIFVEIIVEQEGDREEIHEFAAVVGLIKECKKVRNVFDNAVLWFNDQFLFGEKRVETVNVTPNSSLGVNPEDNNLMQRNGETGRWGGCFTPDGFAHAIGADDPYGVGYHDDRLPDREKCVRTSLAGNNETCQPPNDNMDIIKELIELDNVCKGCIFEYQSSFFITDPNYPNSPQDVSWVVDKLVYPISVMGNLFQEGEDNALNEGDCASGNGTLPVSDPRDDYPHHDRCRDDVPRNNHRCTQEDQGECRAEHRHASGGEGDDAMNDTLVEPLFSVHLQVDWTSPEGMGFVDQAPWEYKDGSGPVKGMPYVQDESAPAFTDCKSDVIQPYECAIEYNFLLAVDFAAFDDNPLVPGENETKDRYVHHGQGEFPQPKARDGNSHPHNPNTFDAGPNHVHDAVNLDIFFHERAPYFVMDNAYWDEHGSPPEVTEDCSTTVAADGDRREAIEHRTPIVCDTDRDDGQYHAHDGSQTIRPTG